MQTRKTRARIFALGFAAVFMLSAVIVGVTLAVNQRPTEAVNNISQGHMSAPPLYWHPDRAPQIVSQLVTFVVEGRLDGIQNNYTGHRPEWGSWFMTSGSFGTTSTWQVGVTVRAAPILRPGFHYQPASHFFLITVAITETWYGAVSASVSGFPSSVHFNIVETNPNVTATATLREVRDGVAIRNVTWTSTGVQNTGVSVNAQTWLGIPTNIPANYEFVGWSPASITINRGTGGNRGTFDFTPIFEPLAPTIHSATFHLHGGNINGATTYTNPIVDGMRTPRPRDPVRLGYKFLGWWTASTGGYEFDFLQPRTSNQTIHAQWEPLDGNYIVLHNAPNLTYVQSTWQYQANRPFTLWLPGTEIMGEYFLGWFTNPEFTDTPVVAVSSTASGVQHLFARWA